MLPWSNLFHFHLFCFNLKLWLVWSNWPIFPDQIFFFFFFSTFFSHVLPLSQFNQIDCHVSMVNFLWLAFHLFCLNIQSIWSLSYRVTHGLIKLTTLLWSNFIHFHLLCQYVWSFWSNWLSCFCDQSSLAYLPPILPVMPSWQEELC